MVSDHGEILRGDAGIGENLLLVGDRVRAALSKVVGAAKSVAFVAISYAVDLQRTEHVAGLAKMVAGEDLRLCCAAVSQIDFHAVDAMG